MEAEIVGYTSCDGCPGGNIEYAVDEMKGNGAEIIHLATGLIVGYPPCPHIAYFHDYIKTKYGLEVVYGTHPIPEKYLKMHEKLGTWTSDDWQAIIKPTMNDEKTRLAYD
jgi:predicted metal-binding protein